MSEEASNETAAQEHPGVPDSQWDAEHPSGEVAEQEAREMEARMPADADPRSAPASEDDEMAGTDAPDEPADAPAEG
jgi:hypothetical protein